MMLTRLLLVTFVVWHVVECGSKKFKTSRRSIDEIVARAGNIKHGKANKNGEFEAFGKKARNSNGVLIEYDIMVKQSEFDRLKRLPLPSKGRSSSRRRSSRSERNKRAAVSNIWTDKVIPFTIRSGDYSSSDEDTIRDAIQEFNQYTCVQWVERTSQSSYVRIEKGDGCWSYVGKIFSSPQTLSLGSGCVFTEVIVHEMIHAAGGYHEQSREDRDQYVIINFGNIPDSAERNFEIAADQNDHGVPYDYRSVMHYSRRAFSSNGQDTITTKNSAFQTVIGQAPTLGENDIRLLSKLYSCDQGCGSVSCPSGAVVGKDCRCFCATGDVNNPMSPCSGGGGNTCTELNVDCSCDSDLDCRSMDNSICSSSGACVCPSGYEVSNNNCEEITSNTCTELNVDCSCDSDLDCISMDNSICSSSGACVCPSGYEVSENNCEEITTGGGEEVTLDGSNVAPFRIKEGRWISRSGTDTSSNGISSNGQYLYSTSQSSSSYPDILESPTLVGSGEWCLRLSGQFDNTKLSVIFIAGNGQTRTSTLSGTSQGYHTPQAFTFTTSSSVKVQIKAEPRGGSSYNFRLDNVRLAKCSA